MCLRHHSNNILNFSLKDQLVHFVHIQKIIGQVESELLAGKFSNSVFLIFGNKSVKKTDNLPGGQETQI